MTIDEMIKSVFSTLEVGNQIYAEFDWDGGLYTGTFRVTALDIHHNKVSLATPGQYPIECCQMVPVESFYSLVNISDLMSNEPKSIDLLLKKVPDLTIGDVIKQTFDSLEVGDQVHADFEYRGGRYSENFTITWIDKETERVSLENPDVRWLNARIKIPFENFFKLVKISNTNKEAPEMDPHDFQKNCMMLMHAKPGEKFKVEYYDSNHDVHNIEAEFLAYDLNNDHVAHFRDPKYTLGPHLFVHVKHISRLEKLTYKIFSEPMKLVKNAGGDKTIFDEKAFYRATNGVRHFLLSFFHGDYECFYMGKTMDGTGMRIAFANKVGLGDEPCITYLYKDKIQQNEPYHTDICDFELYKGDSLCTYEEIKLDEIFKTEEKLEWDIDKLELGAAYSIKAKFDKKSIDGIYMGKSDTPTQNPTLLFSVVYNNGSVHTKSLYQKDLYEGTSEVRELTIKGGYNHE